MTNEEHHIHECMNALVRSQIYGLSSRILSKPDNILNEGLFYDFERITAEMANFEVLRDEMNQIHNKIKKLAPTKRDLNREYTTLFLRAKASPYECSYLPPSRLNQELADIGGFFQAFGLKPGKDRQDHLASELEFMSFVCLKESIAHGNQKNEEALICRDAQTKFLQDHLGRWIGVYHGLLTDKANLCVYPLLVGLVHKILDLDSSYLGIEFDEITEVPVDEVQELPECGFGTRMVG